MAEPITKKLREYIENNRMSNGMGVETMWGNSVPYDLLQIADRIDAEHERRMNEGRIVRCHDCRWMGYIGKHPICTRGITRELVTADDCCSRGKRKEEDDGR